ncbi:hypothetical protein MYSTI_01493 [Myxococcus stipitatus DSM 14675]|uniref:Uncharacterized protein n=1 Tax=Myxococcus stipitatus (strain DSM 14675 / JCM 12634 / Mx s8) TaxID=1278073 RepID=L7U225_MYXSD|nr:hypothetical protein MYSTI_01493 [Myxococcus stipitatus DSM 14675]
MGAGCHREVAPSASRPEGLAGQTLPLLASPALRLTVAGTLGGRSVPVVLDVARPLSMVSQACFDGGAPAPEGTVRAPEIAGGFRAWPVIPLPALTVGPSRVPLGSAGLSGEKPCSVTLGSDVLEPYALTVDPLRREVTFTASRSRESYLSEVARSDAAREVHRMELSREPVGDWPLLAAQVAQGDAELTGPFVLSTREPFSRLAVGPAEAQGLQPLETAANLPPRTFAVDAVDLAAGVGVRPLVVEAAGRWDSPSSLGRLGPDVWGRFTATLDAKGGVLVLRRPRVSAPAAPPPTAGAAPPLAPAPPLTPRQRCSDAQGVFSEEACYGLHVRREPDGGVSLTGAVFRDLPEGGRLYLEPVSAEGQRVESGCAVGLSFPSTSRGLTTQHRLPWPSMAQSLPICHAALTRAKGFKLSLFEEGSQPECPTACAFVTEAATRRTVCECQPTPLGEGVAAPSRKKTSREPPPEERELEPEDPR